ETTRRHSPAAFFSTMCPAHAVLRRPKKANDGVISARTTSRQSASGKDVVYQRKMLDRGVWLEFDMIGLDITFPKEGVAPGVQETA
ncbi:hypothetical protein ONJ17_26775, partial [Salmonella enterica subsp. enterica serovar Agona]|nr:hypothetical protein [Salmonella enterica subsp. enterica serovar Agona]